MEMTLCPDFCLPLGLSAASMLDKTALPSQYLLIVWSGLTNTEKRHGFCYASFCHLVVVNSRSLILRAGVKRKPDVVISAKGHSRPYPSLERGRVM